MCLTCSGVHLVKEKSCKDGQIGLSSNVFKWPGSFKRQHSVYSNWTHQTHRNIKVTSTVRNRAYKTKEQIDPTLRTDCDVQTCKRLPVNGDAETFWWDTCTGGGCDFSKVMCEGKRSSQQLSSLNSTERKTPAVLFSSKEAAIRWNMGSTCT